MAEENPFNLLFGRPASTGTTRLAVLQPGPLQDALKVSLRDCRCLERSYECIGYDRADSRQDISIEVDGMPCSIPQPLEEALRAFRSPDKERYFWADVLIAGTAEERSVQASAIDSIFKNASRMIAWLGVSDPALAAALDVIQTLGNRWQQAALHAEMPSNWTQSRPEQLMTAREKLLSFPPEQLQPANHALWSTMENIFASGYFKCVQSIPELVLAPEVVVAFGDKTIPWETFVNASSFVKGAHRLSKTIETHFITLSDTAYPTADAALRGKAASEKFMLACQLINSREIAIWRYRNDDGLELLPMIQSSRDCSSKDPREFVFCMLPITRLSKRGSYTNAPKPEKPSVDYSKNVQDVFKDAATYIILERQDLLLWWTELPPCRRSIEGLPSWVPDWSSPNPKTGYFVSPNNGLRKWSDFVPSAKPIRVDDSDWHIQAHALDRIETVSAIFTTENCRRLAFTLWQDAPSALEESAQAKADKFWRTLVLDYTGMGESRDTHAKPPAQLSQSWWSVMVEERILTLLNCSMEELATDPELQARAKNDPTIAMLGPLTGKSQPFEELLKTNALGRRFFTTATGRMGMTAIERHDDGESGDESAAAPNFDNAMGSPLARHMLAQFQTYLQQQNPGMAEIVANGIRGELPGQAPPGVRANDVLVACVFGFQPYVLRPENANAVDQGVAGNLRTDSTYTYVGSCYVHGIMDGECFKSRNWIGQESFRANVELVDITIV